MQQNKVSKTQIEEWSENPVTIYFKEIASKELEETILVQGVNAYHPFDPQRTQEVLANLNGAQDTWELVIATLEGKGVLDAGEDEPDSDWTGY